MYYVIAALFIGVGAMLLLATRQPRPKAVENPEAARHGSDHGSRPLHRRPTAKEAPAPERITREEYLRQLAERSGHMGSEHQHR